MNVPALVAEVDKDENPKAPAVDLPEPISKHQAMFNLVDQYLAPQLNSKDTIIQPGLKVIHEYFENKIHVEIMNLHQIY